VKLTIRRAASDDREVIEQLQAESVEWLATRGLDQWQPGQPRAPRDRPGSHLDDALERGTCWIAETDGQIVATITVDDNADPEFWPLEHAEHALYVHRMIVRRSHAGHNLGAVLLDWADQLARGASRPLLRLDAWRTNQALHAYYRNQGFTHVRTLNLAHRGSGALFERPVERTGGRDSPTPSAPTSHQSRASCIWPPVPPISPETVVAGRSKRSPRSSPSG
jgi:GNAT superfamily N-acetyltransferase